MALPGVGGIISVIRRIDRLFDNVEKVQSGLERLDDRVRAIEARLTLLEAGQKELLTEARAAASVAAAGAVTQHLVEMSRRIGMLEAGRRRID